MLGRDHVVKYQVIMHYTNKSVCPKLKLFLDAATTKNFKLEDEHLTFYVTRGYHRAKSQVV
jgi:hypothetical protein